MPHFYYPHSAGRSGALSEQSGSATSDLNPFDITPYANEKLELNFKSLLHCPYSSGRSGALSEQRGSATYQLDEICRLSKRIETFALRRRSSGGQLEQQLMLIGSERNGCEQGNLLFVLIVFQPWRHSMELEDFCSTSSFNGGDSLHPIASHRY